MEVVDMNYYLAKVRTGHISKNEYILKWIPIIAENKKKAAEIARNHPRVLHHDKKAIEIVNRITYDEYLEQKKLYDNDPYFHIHNVQDQRRLCPEVYENTFRKEQKEVYKRTHLRRKLIEESKIKLISKYRNYNEYE